MPVDNQTRAALTSEVKGAPELGTSPAELYIVIAQMAVAFAGFGSLASRLGQREGGDDAKVDAMRLALMLSASLSAALLGLLPFTVTAFGVDERLAVRLSAVVGIVTMLTYAPIGVRRASRIREVDGFSKGGVAANSLASAVAFVAFALCALDVLQGATEALYLLGLMGLLASSIVMFSRVIASMLRPHNEGPSR